MPFTKITNSKIKNDCSPVRTATRNFSRLIPTNSTSKNENVDRSYNKSAYNDNMTPTKQRNEDKDDFKNEIFYDNLYPQSNKLEKITDYKESKIEFFFVLFNLSTIFNKNIFSLRLFFKKKK